jgi:hypothetical protein
MNIECRMSRGFKLHNSKFPVRNSSFISHITRRFFASPSTVLRAVSLSNGLRMTGEDRGAWRKVSLAPWALRLAPSYSGIEYPDCCKIFPSDGDWICIAISSISIYRPSPSVWSG